jgi:hypothetical protein
MTLSTKSAPTTCTDIATASPSTSMNNGASARTGTPRAAATSGSRLANINGRHITATATRTTTEIPSSQPSAGESTATICPVSRPNLFADLPWYSDRNSTPRPGPNGISTPMIEFRSRARTPRSPIRTAAISEPASEPATTFMPRSSAPAAPARESSLMPCTANGRSRIITNTLTTPATIPSASPAIREFRTRTSNAP